MGDEPEEVGVELGAQGGVQGGAVGKEEGVGADMLRRLKTTVKVRTKGDIQNEAYGSGL